MQIQKEYFNPFVTLNNLSCLVFTVIFSISNPLFYYWDELAFGELRRIQSFWTACTPTAAASSPPLKCPVELFLIFLSGIFNSVSCCFSACVLILRGVFGGNEAPILQSGSLPFAVVTYVLLLLSVHVCSIKVLNYESLLYAYGTAMVDFNMVFIGLSAVFEQPGKKMVFAASRFLVNIEKYGCVFLLLAVCVILCLAAFDARAGKAADGNSEDGALMLLVVVRAYGSWFVHLSAFELARRSHLIVGGRLADPIDRLSAKKFNALFVLLLGSAFAVSIYLAYEMRIHLPGDTDIIFASVADLLRDGKLNEANPRIDAMHYPGLGLYTNNDYFSRYPNNIGLLMLYAGVYAFGGKTGLPASTDAGHLPAIVMTSLAVAVTILLVCLCIKIVFKKNSYVLFTLLLCYAFLPFVFSIPNFYTDLWVLPFTAGGVYCYLSNKFSAAPKGWRGFLAGLLLSVGVQMKITAAIGFVVIVLDLLLSRHVHRWKNLALLFLGFFFFIRFYSMVPIQRYHRFYQKR